MIGVGRCSRLKMGKREGKGVRCVCVREREREREEGCEGRSQNGRESRV